MRKSVRVSVRLSPLVPVNGALTPMMGVVHSFSDARYPPSCMRGGEREGRGIAACRRCIRAGGVGSFPPGGPGLNRVKTPPGRYATYRPGAATRARLGPDLLRPLAALLSFTSLWCAVVKMNPCVEFLQRGATGLLPRLSLPLHTSFSCRSSTVHSHPFSWVPFPWEQEEVQQGGVR
ncbi:hypothetical protein SKAU_G00041110 [Synaphobranchus kaupii]|uniref:Uncharacterized protein n=1 Tax=Synaphobranchus kaupii TaxID=118154 RepID=A0A9Q1J7R4_SYNKA|nr:hypothetical protein SKAU_G00041110 [Synaphobranchus kaupii]